MFLLCKQTGVMGWNLKSALYLHSTHINNQNELYLALQYKLKKGWKTYWLSPGEGGFPQKIDWSKSNNIKNIEVLWPTPQEFEILGFKSLGYLNEVVFPLKTTITKYR